MKTVFSCLFSLLFALSALSPAYAWTSDEPPLQMLVVHLTDTETNFCDEMGTCLSAKPLKDDRDGLCTPQRMFLLAKNDKLPLKQVIRHKFVEFTEMVPYLEEQDTVAYVRLYTCKGENGEQLYDVGEPAHAILCVTRGEDDQDTGPILCVPTSLKSFS